MTDTGSRTEGRIRAMRLLIDKGAGRYDRSRHLDRVLGGHAEVLDAGSGDAAATIARLKRALRAERRLGRAGHWSYDLNRHFGLLQALKAELAGSPVHESAAEGVNPGASMLSGASDTGTETS